MILPLFATFLAQTPAPAAGGGSPMTGFLIQMAAIFAIFYFLMIRPQQKAKRQHEERLRNLRKGDAVVTSGGVVAEVVHIKEGVKDGQPARTMEDHVTIKSGDSRFVVERRSITRVATETPAPQPAS